MNTIISKIKKYTVLIVLIVLVLFFSFSTKGFASIGNMLSLVRQVAVLGIASTGMAMLIISGGLDLSIGAQVSLVGCITALLIVNVGFSPILACIIGILLAMILSMFNGIIILSTGMPAMICTLAMMQVLQGVTYTITGAQPIYGLPESLRILGQGYIVGIPVPIIIMIIVFFVGGFILNKTYIGRYFYAVGSNPEAARLSGLPLKKIKLLAFIFSGFFVGLGGIVLMSRMFSGQPSAGDGFEMDVLTACIVGGIAFSGGYGKIEGLIPGVLVMGIISNGLGVMGVSAYDQLMYKGIVLILVVGIDSIQVARAKKQKTRVDNAEILSKTEYDQIAEEKGKMT